MTDERRGVVSTAWHRLRVWAGFGVFWLASVIPHRVHFTRSSYLPRTGPALLVPNHLAVSETTALARMVIGHRRFPHFLIVGHLFSVPLLGSLGRVMKQIPVDRGTVNAAAALELAAAELRKGHLVVIYPEGRISRAPDQRPGPARTGAARLALRMPEIPVLPVGQWGARPGWRSLLRRRRVDLLVGPPVDLGRWSGRSDRQASIEATDAIMAAVTGLVETVRGEPFSAEVPPSAEPGHSKS